MTVLRRKAGQLHLDRPHALPVTVCWSQVWLWASLAVGLCIASASLAGAAGLGEHGGYPRIMGMNIGGPAYYAEPAVQRDFSKHDILIIGFYRGWRGGSPGSRTMREVVRNIKAMNPAIIIGQYTVLQESQAAVDHPNRPKAEKLSAEGWWLMDAEGERVQWTSDYAAFDTNVTAWTRPDARGDRYPEWLAQYDYKLFFESVPEFDIWYLDNALSRPAAKIADWNMDGKNESRADSEIATAYRRGNVAHWLRIRDLSRRVLLIGNSDDLSSDEYRGQLNGAFLEAIIGETWSTETRLGWWAAMDRYRAARQDTAPPQFVGFNVHGAIDDYRTMRYGLASCLLSDGYFSYTEKNSMYRKVAWFDEFDIDLGQPIDRPPTKPWKQQVFRRNFEKGTVLVNPALLPATVEIESGYRHLKGSQDPMVNNGKAVQTVRLAGRDGIVLLKDPL